LVSMKARRVKKVIESPLNYHRMPMDLATFGRPAEARLVRGKGGAIL